MSPRDLPGNLPRADLLAALERLGFEMDLRGGAGSHCKALWPPNQKSVTIPQRIEKNTLRYLLKEIRQYSGHSWEDIKAEL